MGLKIKNIELKSNVLLAPMAGFSDSAFRRLCLNFGAGLVTTEMVSIKALYYRNEKTQNLLKFDSSEHPIAVQIFGHEPEIFKKVIAEKMLDCFDIIDINMGCPARKIVKNGDGSALLNNPQLAEKIIRACVSATDKPVTVKFRLGISDNKNAVSFAKMCEAAGASAITVHGRTALQGYSGTVDYETIAKIKAAVNIPVIANGDCTDFASYKRILSQTGADGVMVGRASLGAPEIFAELVQNPVAVDKLEQIKFHYGELIKIYDEKKVVVAMRSHLAFYIKKMRQSLTAEQRTKLTAAQPRLLKIEKYSELIEILQNILI